VAIRKKNSRPFLNFKVSESLFGNSQLVRWDAWEWAVWKRNLQMEND
jgi:hypothetical protein